ncbi:unnamed protein product [Gadus morhua 'NCC']
MYLCSLFLCAFYLLNYCFVGIKGHTSDPTTAPQGPDNHPAAEGEVRLVNGGNVSCSGRVEVFLQGQWATVCHDDWDLADAQVVCRQLGCGRVLSAPPRATFGPGQGPIGMANVKCNGRESDLTKCGHRVPHPWCGHSEDAGVVCEAAPPVRVVNGTSNNPCSGRVEILLYGQWATVCDGGWDLVDAQVVCRQLGCGRVLSAPLGATFGPGHGPIGLGHVTCNGYESNLTQCGHSGLWSAPYCGHQHDPGVVCEGRVEVFLQGQWATVCDDDWDMVDAQVVCRQLGCGRVLSAPLGATFGPGQGRIGLDDINCTGHESDFTQCGHRGLWTHNCGHQQDAGVVCEAFSPVRLVNGTTNNSCSGRVEVYLHDQWGTICDHGWDLNDAQVVCRQLGCGRVLSAPPASPVKLVNGLSNNPCSGRVEVFLQGQWATVCDRGWDLDDAQVVCRKLGCGRVLSAPRGATFGPGQGPIGLVDINCTGHESELTQCDRGLGTHDCGHQEDAAVVCEGIPDIDNKNNVKLIILCRSAFVIPIIILVILYCWRKKKHHPENLDSEQDPLLSLWSPLT